MQNIMKGRDLVDDTRAQLAEEFLLFIRQMMRGTYFIFHEELDRHAVTWPQFHLLKVVNTRGEVRVTELSNMLMISAPTASRMIDGLVAKGILAKEKDPEDHRVALVRLTDKSEALLADLMSLQNEVMAEVFEGEETADLERTIHHLGDIGRRWSETSEKRAGKGMECERR